MVWIGKKIEKYSVLVSSYSVSARCYVSAKVMFIY